MKQKRMSKTKWKYLKMTLYLRKGNNQINFIAIYLNYTTTPTVKKTIAIRVLTLLNMLTSITIASVYMQIQSWGKRAFAVTKRSWLVYRLAASSLIRLAYLIVATLDDDM